jgi:UDP-N-acetylmuramoyl-tripeptide--D-alanyl-D-alanine ligase
MNNYLSTEELYKLFIACDQKITTDTRKLENGSIFFALKGDNFDANLFASKAIEGGCSIAIVDNEKISNQKDILLVKDVLQTLQDLAKYHRLHLKIPVIGITGSNGKTTNKELIHAVLSKKYNTYATKGNLNNHIGVPLTLLAINSQHEIAIVEMGANHQGEIAMLSEIANPDFGIITNIGKAHLEGFGGVEGVKKGKGELYKYIEKKQGKIFINGDDKVLVDLGNSLTKIYYGENSEFDVYGKLFQNSEFVEFKWNIKNSALDNQKLLKTNMFGHYNFINLLCAACVGNYFKVNEKDINDALQSYIPEMNRSQVKKTLTNTIILDAYNANPSSMSLAIDNFKNQPFENKIVVIGDMLELGEYSKQEHYKVLKELTNSNLKEVYLVGGQLFDLKDEFLNFSFFKTMEELIQQIISNKIVNSYILIKGSRGLKLEKVVDYL